MEPGGIERSFGSRFRATRVIKRGEGLETLAARDLEADIDLILKVVAAKALTPAVKARLHHEIAALNQLLEPSLATPIHLHAQADEGLLVVARPNVPGPSLEERIAVSPLDARETIALGIRILSSLARAHGSGVLHRDIKPSNVILVDGRPDRAVLIDFGLARHSRLAHASEEYALRAARYLSPEQLGLIRRGVDARSDLYSTGAVLYEALTRQPAFSGSSSSEVLRGHLTRRPVPVNERAPGVPSALARVIERLLRKDPRDRYHTAAGALADLEDLATALEQGVEEPAIVVGSRDARRIVTEPAFIVRPELWKLASARAAAQEGRGVLVVLEAESGGGKTWLLDELGRQSAPLGVRVLRGRGVDQAAQRPYQMLSGVAFELISAARTEPGLRARLTEALGPLTSAACASLPELRAIFPEADPQAAGPEAYGEARSIAALSALLDALGSQAQPALVLLDDAQWADEPTVRLLDQWLAAPPEGPTRHVTVVLALRPEDVPTGHPLETLRASQRLRLRSFTVDDVRNQVASMAGNVPEEAVQTILRSAGGNPFLVSATVHALVEVGALVNAPAAWHFNPSALSNLHAPERAGSILTVRLAKLDERSRELLTVGAVQGSTFDPVLAGSLAGIEPHDAVRLAEACAGSLVWEESAGGSFTFVHDKIREALLARLGRRERMILHLLAAEHIEAEDRTRSFDLAYHFDAAEEPQRALEHALSAAEQARAQFALDLAERHYRIAARGAVDAPRGTQFRIAKGLAEVLTLRSRYDEAETFFEKALGLAGDGRERAEVEERWGSFEMKRGNMRAACLHCEQALRLMGRWVPRSKLGCVLWSLWELLVQVLHTYWPRLFVGRRPLAGAEDELFVIRIFHGLNGPYFFSRGVEWAGWAHLRLINLAERYPPCLELGRAYAAHAVCLNGFPSLFPRGLRISKMGAELCERLGDPWGQAQGLTFHAMMLHYLGRFAESYEVGKTASALFDRTGDRWEANSGLDFAVDSLFRMGDLKEAVRLARHIWQRGHEIGDSHALAWSLDAWSRATDGRGVPKEVLEAERARPDHFVQTALALDQAEGVRLLGTGSPREAALLLEEARRRNLKEAGFFYDLNAPILIYLVAALRTQAEAVPPWAPQKRARLLAEARRASKRAMAVGRKFRNNLAHALREDAHVAAMSGQIERARSELEESIAVAEALAQRYESALSRQALGRLGEAHGWEGACAQRKHAEEELQAIRLALASELPVERPSSDAQTFSLVERFATLLVAGRALATALTPEAVYAELRHAALTLLRAERCVILSLRIEGMAFEVTPVHGDGGLPIRVELVRRAVGRRHAVAFSASDLVDPDIRRAAIRSVLCVPIIVRGSAWGCLYVAHGEIDELFGEQEERIGEFLGTLAGAALENAQGFSAVHGFSRVLESRDAERTEELERANREIERNLRHLRQTQEQLLEAGKMAAIGTLIAGLSHELNNPLAVIVGYAHSLLQELPSDTSSRKPLAAIEREATRCSLLVRALLNFSHATGSRRERVRISTICHSVMHLVAGTAKARDVHLETHIDPHAAPELVVCPQEIESALLNLVANAIDASPPGRAIELQVRPPSASDESGVEFAIRHVGEGIPTDMVPTGLGLSLTTQIVQSHGGRIQVETAPGEGTRMVVWLPLTSERDAQGQLS